MYSRLNPCDSLQFGDILCLFFFKKSHFSLQWKLAEDPRQCGVPVRGPKVVAALFRPEERFAEASKLVFE